MPVLPIITYPNQSLKTKCAHIDAITDDVLKEIDQLIETMYSFPGCVGIAAPQAGICKSMAIIDASCNAKAKSRLGKQVLINPTIIWQDGEENAREGCLSLPHLTGNVKRPSIIRFRAMTIDGKMIEEEVEGFEARVVMHEVDHLNGLLFLDRVSSLKTDVFRRKRYLPGNPDAGPKSLDDISSRAGNNEHP